MTRAELEREIARFDPTLPIERAPTPPASWYTRPDMLELERERVFRRGWTLACRTDEVAEPGACRSAEVAGDAYLIVRGHDGELRGFHNVCRHHAARLVEGAACAEELVCPYHGWTYALSGALKTAPRSAGLADFRRDEWGLVPVHVDTWGPLVFLHPGQPERTLAEELAELTPHLDPAELARLTWVTRRSYAMACNWKVFVDNYLDGGYHIAHLHGNLASQLDLASYRTELYPRFNVQTCPAHPDAGAAVGQDYQARMGQGATYAWLFPNLTLNRYGPTLDTNLILPTGPTTCEVVFDYWFDGSPDEAQAFVQSSLESSDTTQREDVWISEQVQRGLHSVAYDRGRYAPTVEHAMHHFHRLLAGALGSHP